MNSFHWMLVQWTSKLCLIAHVPMFSWNGSTMSLRAHCKIWASEKFDGIPYDIKHADTIEKLTITKSNEVFVRKWPTCMQHSIVLIFNCTLLVLCESTELLWLSDLRPQTLNCEVPGSNLQAAAVVPLGKALYPHCLVPRKGLKAIGPLP